MLLADVFENFRDVCCKYYSLDPAHYYTAPGLAWDAALKVSKVNLELSFDLDILLMVEKGIRGGVSMISNRYGKANNKYMGDEYDATKHDATKVLRKTFFKLMNNSVFGTFKTMENITNRVDVRLVIDRVKAKKLAAKLNLDHSNIFNENLISIHMKKIKLVFNKPVYIGMCILDLSKILMYDFHYNYIKREYGAKAKLLFTYTDSLIY